MSAVERPSPARVQSESLLEVLGSGGSASPHFEYCYKCIVRHSSGKIKLPGLLEICADWQIPVRVTLETRRLLVYLTLERMNAEELYPYACGRLALISIFEERVGRSDSMIVSIY